MDGKPLVIIALSRPEFCKNQEAAECLSPLDIPEETFPLEFIVEVPKLIVVLELKL